MYNLEMYVCTVYQKNNQMINVRQFVALMKTAHTESVHLFCLGFALKFTVDSSHLERQKIPKSGIIPFEEITQME